MELICFSSCQSTDGCAALPDVDAEEEETVELEGLPEIVWGENEIVVKRRTVMVRRVKGSTPAARVNQEIAAGQSRVHPSSIAATVRGYPCSASPSIPGGTCLLTHSAASGATTATRLTLEQQQILFRKGMQRLHEQRQERPRATSSSTSAHAPETTLTGTALGLDQGPRSCSTGAFSSLERGQTKDGPSRPVGAPSTRNLLQPGSVRPFSALLPTPTFTLLHSSPSLPSGSVDNGLGWGQQVGNNQDVAENLCGASQHGTAGVEISKGSSSAASSCERRNAHEMARDSAVQHWQGDAAVYQPQSKAAHVATLHLLQALFQVRLALGVPFSSLLLAEHAVWERVEMDFFCSPSWFSSRGTLKAHRFLSRDVAHVWSLESKLRSGVDFCGMSAVPVQRHQQEQQRKAEACQLFTRTGACPFGPSCRRGHLYPPLERCCTILLPSLLSAWLDTPTPEARERAGADAQRSPASASSPGTSPLLLSSVGLAHNAIASVVPYALLSTFIWAIALACCKMHPRLALLPAHACLLPLTCLPETFLSLSHLARPFCGPASLRVGACSALPKA